MTGVQTCALPIYITATNSPTSFNATNLPTGLSINTTTGVISGTPTFSGTTNVSITATNVSGSDTRILELTISTVTGIANRQAIEDLLFLFPNPVSDRILSIQSQTLEGEALLSIQNAQGVLTYEGIILLSSHHSTISLKNMPAGMYIVLIEHASRKYVKKIIIQ